MKIADSLKTSGCQGHKDYHISWCLPLQISTQSMRIIFH